KRSRDGVVRRDPLSLVISRSRNRRLDQGKSWKRENCRQRDRRRVWSECPRRWSSNQHLPVQDRGRAGQRDYHRLQGEVRRLGGEAAWTTSPDSAGGGEARRGPGRETDFRRKPSSSLSVGMEFDLVERL